MPPVKPVEYLDWNDSLSNVIDPPSGLKSTGYLPTEVPASQHHNWLFNLMDQWIKWLDYFTSVIEPTTGIASRGFIPVNFAASPFLITPSMTGQVLLVDSSGGPVVLDLPDPVSNPGFVVSVVDVLGTFPVNPCTVHRFGTEKIGYLAADYIISASGISSFGTNAVDWIIIEAEPAQVGTVIPNSDASGGQIATGNSMFWPFMIIPVGKTRTVQAGAQLVGVSSITANGTLTINGTARIL